MPQRVETDCVFMSKIINSLPEVIFHCELGQVRYLKKRALFDERERPIIKREFYEEARVDCCNC